MRIIHKKNIPCTLRKCKSLTNLPGWPQKRGIEQCQNHVWRHTWINENKLVSPIALEWHLDEGIFVFSNQMFLQWCISFEFCVTLWTTERQLVFVTLRLVTVQLFRTRTNKVTEFTGEGPTATTGQMKCHPTELAKLLLSNQISLH